MTNKELDEIESTINGESEPDTVWFVETIRRLIDEVRDSWVQMQEQG